MRISEEAIFHHGPYFLQKTAGKKLNARPHNHDFFEIVIVLSGYCCHFIDGEHYPMEAMSAVLLHPDNYHYFLSQSADADLLVLSVTVSEMDKFRNAYEISPVFITQNCPVFFDALPLQLLKIISDSPDPTMLYRIFLGQILHEILIHQADTSPAPIPSRLRTLLDSLSKPASLSVHVNDLADLSGYSYPHLFRLMKQHTGKTPHAYLNDLKMKQACSLLERSDKSAEEISELLGFSSYSHFSKTFRNYYGVTPGSVRKKRNHPISTV